MLDRIAAAAPSADSSGVALFSSRVSLVTVSGGNVPTASCISKCLRAAVKARPWLKGVGEFRVEVR